MRGAAVQKEEGYKFVYLPGLFQVSRLLNNTEGIATVATSRIRKARPRGKFVNGKFVPAGKPSEAEAADGAPAEGAEGAEGEAAAAGEEGGDEAAAHAEHLVGLIADAAEAAETGATAGSEAGADGAAGPPQGGSGRLRIALNGKSRGAHQLTARGGAGWEDKTQLLFVTPEAGFGREQLVEKLRALELVLGFELAVDVVDGGMHMPGDA